MVKNGDFDAIIDAQNVGLKSLCALIVGTLANDAIDANDVAVVRQHVADGGAIGLNSSIVRVLSNCLQMDMSSNPEPATPMVTATGIQKMYGFSAQKVDVAERAIKVLLFQLPDAFFAPGFKGIDFGGGWVFQNMLNNWQGEQWTGLHPVMESLLVMGLASGWLSYLSGGSC